MQTEDMTARPADLLLELRLELEASLRESLQAGAAAAPRWHGGARG